VSIGRRLIDLARSELNSLLDRASSSDDDDLDGDPDKDLYHRYGVSALTDEELERELDRRRKAREAAAKEAAAARTARPRPQEPPRPSPPPRPSSSEEIRRAYAALEVKAGADFLTVRKSYRTLMRKYHPDRYGQTPEKQKAANELAAKLTHAYDVLEKHLRK
jgi:DnaJ-domain-containing protein 1